MLKELKTKQGGFTLVELAIVMVIIGLLIGGILKGQELIKNAAISATAAQIKAFESAFVTFEDIYQAKPGDFAEARNRIPNCNGANRCNNGDRNGYIWHSNSIASNNGRAISGTRGEMRQALKQMALTNLIGGVDPADRGTPDGLVKSDLGGYLYIGESWGNGTYHRGGGRTPSGIYVGQTFRDDLWAGYGQVTTPGDIARLDRKIDDGAPGAGAFLVAGYTQCVRGREYRENYTEKRCSFISKIK